MIRFRIQRQELAQRIDQHDPKWSGKAKTRTKTAVEKGGVADGDGIWSDIKDVYMTLQGWKCMYCEKPMPRPDPAAVATGKVEYDVEHFRPKNRVTSWPTERVQKARTIDYAGQLRQGAVDGYVRLAFDPWNYGVSCKTCNSELKGDRFPILGKPDVVGSDRGTLDEKERPCLLLPIGDDGPDPENWLEWLGPVVRAKVTLTGDEALRARTLVDFFELDNRPDLLLIRCFAIEMLWAALRDEADGDPGAAERINAATADDAVFAGCTRAFLRMYRQDPAAARQWRNRARDYAARKEPKLLEIVHG